jgi:hypothetical protein
MNPTPSQTKAEIEQLLHRFQYTFAPDGTIKPDSYVTLDIPQALAAIQAIVQAAEVQIAMNMQVQWKQERMNHILSTDVKAWIAELAKQADVLL